MSEEEHSTYLQKVYTAADNRDLEAAYDNWAKKYDAHVNAFGYQIPAVAAGLIGRYVKSGDSPILDAGAGTGLMGQILDAMGYTGQIGIDMSVGMMDLAEKRGVYIDLRQMILGDPLDFPDNYFAACQSMGVFTAGHAPSNAFDELTRVVRPGGSIIFSLLEKVYIGGGFKEKFDQLEASQKWALLERTKAFPGLPLEDPTLLHRVFVYSVL